MTSEDIIIEILFESDRMGIRENVINQAKKLGLKNSKLSRVESYELAFKSFDKICFNMILFGPSTKSGDSEMIIGYGNYSYFPNSSFKSSPKI